MAKPLILVTNDDGIRAPGIRNLARIASEFGDVYVVAPNKPQSGMGHAVTIDAILHCEEVQVDAVPVREWSCSGTPADCVKLAIKELLPRRPDLCLSGINHGSNSSINVIYSGTMSAAIEAGIEGIPAIGFSLMDYAYDADFTQAEPYMKQIIAETLKRGMPKEVVFNVNIPKLTRKEFKGIKVTRQAKANWVEDFIKRENPRGKPYYWLTGEFVNLDPDDKNDIKALEEGYITIVPTQFDLTAHQLISQVKEWDFTLS